ncbi:MAG: PEGA domain-containing protein [Proteobacteria bacterium]|nr:PEGA domain-containing protein [Pseudomonadota bacterium]
MKRLIHVAMLAIALVAGFSLTAWADAPTRIPISIYTEPAGGVVHIDNQKIGNAPVTDWVVAPGTHKVAISRQGKVVCTREIKVSKAERFTINAPMSVACAAMCKKCMAAMAKCAACKKAGKTCAMCAEMCAKCADCKQMSAKPAAKAGSDCCGDCKRLGKTCPKCATKKCENHCKKG